MSGVAFDGKTLAVDKGCFNGDQVSRITKLHEIKYGEKNAVIALTGSLAHSLTLLSWIINNPTTFHFKAFKELPESEADICYGVILVEDGTLFKIYGNGGTIMVEDSFCAEGSAMEFLMGALVSGADSKTAMKLAIKYRGDCALGVDHISLDDFVIKTEMV